MTFRAGDPRMRSVLVGHQLGFHDRVAGLAAELDRLGKIVGIVAAHRREEEEEHRAGKKSRHSPAIAGTGKINLHHWQKAAGAAAFAPLAQQPDQRQEKPQKQKSRGDDVGENADVGIGEMRDGIQNEQQEKGEQAADHNDQTRSNSSSCETGTAGKAAYPRFQCSYWSNCHGRNVPALRLPAVHRTDNNKPLRFCGYFRSRNRIRHIFLKLTSRLLTS